MMVPTARAAPGRPANRATSPYVVTRPGGMRRSTARTFSPNAVIGRSKHEFDAAADMQPAHAEVLHRAADVWMEGRQSPTNGQHHAGALVELPRQPRADLGPETEVGVAARRAGWLQS